jgi:hypothetical protein
MSCDCASNLYRDKHLQNEIKKAICLLNNYIYSLRINQKLMIKSRCDIHIPKCLLLLIKKLILPCTICRDDCCCNDQAGQNICSKCKNIILPPEYAFYCDSVSMKTKRLARKDIVPVINCGNDDSFLRSINQLIYKYEGFVHFFTKVNESIEDINSSERTRVY